jgi:hypothetical protein
MVHPHITSLLASERIAELQRVAAESKESRNVPRPSRRMRRARRRRLFIAQVRSEAR